MKLSNSLLLSLLMVFVARGMGDSNDPQQLESLDIKVASALMDGIRVTSLGQRYAYGTSRAYAQHLNLLHSLEKDMPQELQEKLSSLKETGQIFIMNDDKKKEMEAIENPAFGTPHGIWINPDHLGQMPPEIASHATQVALLQTEHGNYDFRKLGIYNGLILAAGESASHFAKLKIDQGKLPITSKQLKWAKLGWYTCAPVVLSLTPLEKTISHKLFRNNLEQIITSPTQLREIAQYYQHKIGCSSSTHPENHARLSTLIAKRNLYLEEAERMEVGELAALEKQKVIQEEIASHGPKSDPANKAAFTQCVLEKAEKQFGPEAAQRMLLMPCATQPLLSQCKKQQTAIRKNNKTTSANKEASVQ